MEPAVVTIGLGKAACDATSLGLAMDYRVSGLPARIRFPDGSGAPWMSPTEQCRLALVESAANVVTLRHRFDDPDLAFRMLDGPVDCGTLVEWPESSTRQWRMGGCGDALLILEADRLLSASGAVLLNLTRTESHATITGDPPGRVRYGLELAWSHYPLVSFVEGESGGRLQ